MAEGTSGQPTNPVKVHMERGNLVDANKAWTTVGTNKGDRIGSDLERPGDKGPDTIKRKPARPGDK